ncbi:MAG TPA: acetylxylan esterase [Rariglobus sp.]|jgi:cephalosporin-C deacetylase-like acetyl esterase|nr:acetylxylan esterase [Rariglobus sp.]
MPPVVARPDHTDGLYHAGETVTWKVEVSDPDKRAELSAVPYVVTRDGAGEISHGVINLSSGSNTVSATRSEPGALLLQVGPVGKSRTPLGLGGAVIDPKKIGPAVPAPADFDAFWQAKLKELAQVPMNPVLRKVDNLPGSTGVEYAQITLDNIWHTKVQGQIAWPAKAGKFPAMLILHAAGVYPLNPGAVLSSARKGWLVLDIMAHDLPIDGPADFYKEQKANALKDYEKIGNEDRDTSYFLRMFLGCARAADYLASRPDWDGKVLVVTGISQGGLQSFATAGLCPKVSGLMVLVPAGCDTLGPLANPPRAISWPGWLTPYPGRDMEKVRKAAPYFDAIYFAQRAKCPALVGVGLIDEISRPAGVIAAYNALSSPAKELLTLPFSNHHGSFHAQAPYNPRAAEWMAAFTRPGPFVPPAKP